MVLCSNNTEMCIITVVTRQVHIFNKFSTDWLKGAYFMILNFNTGLLHIDLNNVTCRTDCPLTCSVDRTGLVTDLWLCCGIVGGAAMCSERRRGCFQRQRPLEHLNTGRYLQEAEDDNRTRSQDELNDAATVKSHLHKHKFDFLVNYLWFYNTSLTL